MIREKILIGYYGYRVLLTYISMISAVFGMYFAFAANIRNAIVCLMISGVCDTFDGRVARLKKRNVRELNYGIQIDSMADLISFGALLFVSKIKTPKLKWRSRIILCLIGLPVIIYILMVGGR